MDVNGKVSKKTFIFIAKTNVIILNKKLIVNCVMIMLKNAILLNIIKQMHNNMILKLKKFGTYLTKEKKILLDFLIFLNNEIKPLFFNKKIVRH